jgi:S-DNA-T family DNA segregation ATPase FtsK/SpoIIIE
MARRVTKPNTSTSTGNKTHRQTASKPSLRDYLLSTRDMVQSYQFHLILGIILSTITLMLIVAFVSFFFTGGNDYSIIVQANRQDLRDGIQNTLGLPGAVVARWLIDGTFGITSAAALVAMTLYSIRLITPYRLRGLRVLFICLFILVWGSIALGFIQQQVEIG